MEMRTMKIYLKNKIDEKVLNDTLTKIGLISIEIKNDYFKSLLDRGGIFSLIADAANIAANIVANAANIVDDIVDDTAQTTVSPPSGELYFSSRTYYKFSLVDKISLSTIKDDFFIGSHIRLDAEESCIYICDYNGNIISGMKEILFKEKILDKVYDKAEEYKNNLEKYEANTDDIIEKIEEKNSEPYNLFIIKHFIKFVMDKYKQENISSEDNSSNENIENTEEAKNISNNPFINDGE